MSYVVLALSCQLAVGQPPQVEPTPEHTWLKKFAGEWTTSSQAFGPDDEVVMECEGKSSNRMLGEFWIVSGASSDMPGMQVRAIQTIGYDTKAKQYVGTWIDSVSDHMWHYTGQLNEAGTKLTLEAEGPNFMGDGKLTKFRDAYEFKTADHLIATSLIETEDGEWVEIMRGEMRRVEEP